MRKEMEVLVPTTNTRKCDKCGEWTWWARPRQPTHGMCPDCAGQWVFQPTLPGLEYTNVVLDVLDAFPGSTVVDPADVPARPDELGPCSLCRAPTRLYGTLGSPLCRACLESR